MTKGYVLLERGFEYDDNYYNEYENGGGNPKNFFFNKEIAKRKMTELNIERCKLDIVSYYDPNLRDRENAKLSEFCNSLIEKYGPLPKSKYGWDDDNKYKIHPSCNYEEGEAYLKLIGFSFYEIIEVELDPSDIRENSIDKILK